MRCRFVLLLIFVVVLVNVHLPVLRAEQVLSPAPAVTLDMLLESEDGAAIRRYLTLRRDEILRNSDDVIKALILWRRLGDFPAAMELAEDARSRGLAGDRRLDFETAISFWLNGSCLRAAPLFRKLHAASGPSADWISRESARFLADCRARLSWRLSTETRLGYDTNLGGSVPERVVIPEPGSQVGTSLDRLQLIHEGGSVAPGFTIGTPAHEGFWAEIMPYLEWQHPLKQGGLTFRIGSTARLTSRREYHGQAHHAAASYLLRAGGHILSASAAVRHDRDSLGPIAGNQWSRRQVLRVSSAIRINRTFSLLAGATGRKLKGMHTTGFSARYQGFDLGLSYQGKAGSLRLAEPAYRLSFASGQDTAHPRWSSGHHKGIALHLGPFRTGQLPLRVELRHDRKSYDHIRPWLHAGHDRKLVSLTLATTYAFVQGYPVRIDMEWYKSRSRDPVEQNKGVKFSLGFRH